jgi:hypothetical protein
MNDPRVVVNKVLTGWKSVDTGCRILHQHRDGCAVPSGSWSLMFFRKPERAVRRATGCRQLFINLGALLPVFEVISQHFGIYNAHGGRF